MSVARWKREKNITLMYKRVSDIRVLLHNPLEKALP
jgi:hypothetical protein